MKTWRFIPLDSLFFREARPFQVIGNAELSSVFPPSPATMAGAIRSAIGECNHVNWENYPNEYIDLHKQIGDGDSLGTMRIKGVFLSRKIENRWQRLYPTPAHLVVKDKTVHFLQVGKPVHCDLGKAVCLAVAPKDEKGENLKGIKPLESYWLTETAFEQVLNGNPPEFEQLICATDLFCEEPRLGIARNNQTRMAEQGLLYQTQHIRPKLDLAIEVDISGLETVKCPESGIVRLGGEGRGAAFTVDGTDNTLPTCSHYENAQGIKLILLTALFLSQAAKEDSTMTASPLKDWQSYYTPLPNFKKHEENGKTVWKGEINNIKLTLHCAIIGKSIREGGWDFRKKQAKPLRYLLPAGSVFYCKVDNGCIKNAIKILHGQHIHSNNILDQHLGRGLLAVCPWFEHDHIKEHLK